VLLRAPSFAEEHRPDLVVRIGDTPTSKPLRAWLTDQRQVVVDPDGAWHEPTRTAEVVVRADAGRLCDWALATLLGREPARDPAWLQAWCVADAVAARALGAVEEP